ncbi:hypothetical protein EDC96DRAFT_516963 [Choanephora cucurbitarum]|nr:hypothetical protein EDC96DRAFT_516963 [Choanephora cucurbitarum]
MGGFGVLVENQHCHGARPFLLIYTSSCLKSFVQLLVSVLLNKTFATYRIQSCLVCINLGTYCYSTFCLLGCFVSLKMLIPLRTV